MFPITEEAIGYGMMATLALLTLAILVEAARLKVQEGGWQRAGLWVAKGVGLLSVPFLLILGAQVVLNLTKG